MEYILQEILLVFLLATSLQLFVKCTNCLLVRSSSKSCYDDCWSESGNISKLLDLEIIPELNENKKLLYGTDLTFRFEYICPHHMIKFIVNAALFQGII